MGIPSYFRKIINDFPEVIKSNVDNQPSNLFLDFNCCIHGCSNELKKNTYENHEDFEKDLIKSVLEYIDKIFDFVKPKELFYISIDGIPPRSKMIQQRNRRFMKDWRNEKLISALRKKKLNNEIDLIENEWNSSAISPGTKFMDKLSKQINNKLNSDNKYKYIKSILSDSHNEGEGEYKIYNYMTKNKITKDSIIYGLDADLIMLSLLNNTNIHLLREPLFLEMPNNEPFLYVSINKLKESIKLYYNEYFPIDKDNLINNYVFLSFLLGNDFVPHISFISIKNNSLEELLNFYKNISNNLNENILIVTENKKKNIYKINYNFLTELFHELSKIETDKLIDMSNNHFNKRPFIKKFDNQLDYFKNMLELYPQLNKNEDLIKVGHKNWKNNYYYYKFNTLSTKDIRDISLNYLETLEFTLDYYFHQEYHPTFYYRFNNSPLILDVYNYLLSLKIDNIEDTSQIKIDIPYNELYPNIKISIPLQLLMILPPSSIDLINKKYHKFMTDINQGVLHYYPDDFKVDTYLKDYLWLCNPILPDIDINLLNSKL